MPFDMNPNPPRPEVTSNYYRTLTYQDVDRTVDTEFGYWPQTARRWLAEGMDEELTEDDIQSMFGVWMDRHFGFDDWHCQYLPLKTHLNPAFEDTVIEEHLDAFAARQQEDGGWAISWPAVSPACELEWRGFLTVAALLLLRAYGRI